MTGSSPLIVVCGPTATGKSDLAESLALSRNGVILSADSMQIYAGMDIGTAKVPPDARAVPYHGLDLVAPDEPYSAALFQAYGRSVLQDMDAQGTPVIMAGGTGFYIKAVIDDLRFPAGEQQNNPVRERFQRIAEEEGGQAVWDILNDLDPESAAQIHPHNVKRTIRALEMAEAGERYADRAEGLAHAAQLYDARFIGLEMERSLLYERIDARVDAMREAGLVDEVRSLAEAGFAESLTSRQAIGYKEVLNALEGACTMDQAFEDIKRASRRYAKRQLTWFRKDERILWMDVTDMTAEEIALKAERMLETKEEGGTCGA